MKERLVQVLAKEAPMRVGMDNVYIITRKRRLSLWWYLGSNIKALYYTVERWRTVTDIKGREMVYICTMPDAVEEFEKAVKRAEVSEVCHEY